MLERRWPGDFGYGTAGDAPDVITWFAFVGAVAGLVAGTIFFRRRWIPERHTVAAIAAGLFVRSFQSARGIDQGVYPSNKIITIGISTTF